MITFFMFGTYSSEAVKEIHPERTRKALKIIKAMGGKVKGMYAILGDYDLVLIVESPDIDTVVKISIELHMMTGIHFSSLPAMPVEYFDALISKK
ncbi:MAG TPA: GYD domain-containing protein [Thermodesulfovibrionales bacterium]|nr:GYD domain-containing protein [Thermodesulfovibrionales bacterium]